MENLTTINQNIIDEVLKRQSIRILKQINKNDIKDIEIKYIEPKLVSDEKKEVIGAMCKPQEYNIEITTINDKKLLFVFCLNGIFGNEIVINYMKQILKEFINRVQ